MTDIRVTLWKEFDALGIVEMRMRLGAKQYSEDTERLAREWLAHHESLRVSEANREVISTAKEANILARQANDFAEAANSTADRAASSAALSAAAARTNNIIATLALIAATIAIAISIIGVFMKK